MDATDSHGSGYDGRGLIRVSPRALIRRTTRGERLESPERLNSCLCTTAFPCALLADCRKARYNMKRNHGIQISLSMLRSDLTVNASLSADHTPLLLIDDLHFAYPDGRVALRGVHLRIARGEKVALVGPNGAGKSTLLLHLNGVLRGNGRIEVAGLPVSERTLSQVRARVGLVFQNPDDQLFSPTVFEDVAFGPLHMGLAARDVQARVERALALVGMSTYRERHPYHLSMGEKKRIAIATVLAMEPEILAFDEPSAGLDPRARRGLIHLLRDLPLTMLVSTHDMAMVQELCDRMIIMDEGRIVADGKAATLLDDEALLEAHGLETPWKERGVRD